MAKPKLTIELRSQKTGIFTSHRILRIYFEHGDENMWQEFDLDVLVGNHTFKLNHGPSTPFFEKVRDLKNS